MTNPVDPDQTASSGIVWSASTLFHYAHFVKNFVVCKILGHLPYIWNYVIMNCVVKSLLGTFQLKKELWHLTNISGFGFVGELITEAAVVHDLMYFSSE